MKIGYSKIEQKPQVEAIGITLQSLKGTNRYANTVISGRAVLTEQEGFNGDAVLHVNNAQEEKDVNNKVYIQSVKEIKNLKIHATLAAPVGANSISTVSLPVTGKAYLYKKGDLTIVAVTDEATVGKLVSMVETLSDAHPESGDIYDFAANADGLDVNTVVVIRVFREFTDLESAVIR